MIALAYIRRSKNSKKRPSVSPERQAANIGELCQAKGWAVEWFSDTEGHMSGMTESKRPAWLQLKVRLASAPPATFAAVVVNSLDRSSRKAKDFLNFLDALKVKKCDFISVTQPYLDTTTPYGRAMIASMMIYAQLEAEIDSQRLVEDIAYRQSEGQMWGPIPLGYARASDQDGVRLRLRAPDPDAPFVLRLLEAYAKGDVSMRGLARAANLWPAAHIPGGFWRMRRRDGSRVPFSHRSIESLLDNAPIYAGQVVRYRGKEGEEEYVGKHDAIITPELADQVLRVRRQREDKSLTSGRRRGAYCYLLTPLLHCATCGKAFRGQMLAGRPRYWHGTGSHGWARIDADRLEALALHGFRGLTAPPEDIAAIAHEIGEAQESPESEQQRARLRLQLEREQDLYRFGDTSRAVYQQRRGEIERQLLALEPRSDRAIPDIAATLSQLQAYLVDPHPDKRPLQKALLATFVERIETDGQKITLLTLWPLFEATFKRVILVYPQPDSSGRLDQLLTPREPTPIIWDRRLADRNAALVALRRQGWTYRALAARFGISLARCQQIVTVFRQE